MGLRNGLENLVSKISDMGHVTDIRIAKNLAGQKLMGADVSEELDRLAARARDQHDGSAAFILNLYNNLTGRD